MTSSTLLNHLNKAVGTQINSEYDVLPDLTGKELSYGYKVESRLNVVSGEADLYLCSKDNCETAVLKIYRRVNAVKNDVLETLKSVKHKNIGAIIAHGEYLNHSYVILPYYNKGTIADLVSNGGMDISSIKTKLLPQLIEGLNAIHNAGLLHRDLKPSNIMLDDEGNLVIIDFGISSITDGRSVLFTNTGMTPEYLAPEAFSSNYLVETDYYALGIILYELHTGHTPYKNISPEQAASYASVQKIPFDDSFDKDLKELILGLTYKDISNRHEKNNPNRRWTYTEVKNWLDGKKQQIPGSAVKEESYKNYIPYKFKGQMYINNSELINALLQNWNDGIKELGRGFLSRHFDNNSDEQRKIICEKAESALSNNSEKTDYIFYNTMYALAGTDIPLYWKGLKFDSLTAYGNTLIEAANREQKEDEEVIATATNFLVNGILSCYIQSCVKNQNEYEKIIKANLEALNNNPLEPKYQALRLGYALTGIEKFTIKNIEFSSIDEFAKKIKTLRENDIENYFLFIQNNKTEIHKISQVFSGDKKLHFDKCISRDKGSIVINDIFSFANWKEFENCVNSLYERNKLVILKGIIDQSKHLVSGAPNEIQTRLQNLNNLLICIDGNLYKDKAHLMRHLKDLQLYLPEELKLFMLVHKRTINRIFPNGLELKPQSNIQETVNRGNNSDYVDKILKLSEQFNQGQISKEDFLKRKSELLSSR